MCLEYGQALRIPIPVSLEKSDFSLLHAPNCQPCGHHYRKKDHLWYEMRTDRLTDLVMFINYDVRLFSGRLDPPAFVDQRLIQLNPLDDVDIGLCHALLNSSIGMFIIEALGFGRALGALDLNKERIEKFMHILDPSALDPKLVEQIKTAFAPLLERELFNLADEIEKQDRQYFYDVIIEAFNLKVPREAVYESLRELVSIRLSVKN